MHLLKQTLNYFKPVNSYAGKAALALICFALLTGLSCGKRTPPLPPIERVQQRVIISGTQRGSLVILSWTMPARNAPDGSILNISRADVYRLAEPAGAPLTLSEEEFASRSTLIAAIPITDEDFARKQFTFNDSLEFSNFLLIEPSARVANPPQNLTYTVFQESITLSWNAPQTNVDGTQPANVLGYNIYRTENGAAPRLLNQTPVTYTRFADTFFEFGRSYSYFLRAISLGTEGEPVESLNSEIINIKPLDIFPPTPPTGITIAAAPNNISIFFAVNPETDVAGYRIYRTTDANLPRTEWALLTPELLTTNTFQDTNIVSGTTYFYFLTAVDNAGNISEPSETVSETAP
jgi:hypothetical protein